VFLKWRLSRPNKRFGSIIECIHGLISLTCFRPTV
jgi:hypothetical protein